MSKEELKPKAKPNSVYISKGGNRFSIKPTEETQPYSLDIILQWRHPDYSGTNYDYETALSIAEHMVKLYNENPLKDE